MAFIEKTWTVRRKLGQLTNWKKENGNEGCDDVGPRVEAFV